MRLSMCVFLASLVPAGGCTPTIQGDAWPHCEEIRTEVGLDEVTPLGFAASEALARLPPSESTTLTWADATTTSLSLSYQPAGTAWFVDSEAVYPQGGEVPAIAVICTDHVAVDVAFDLATADGAFDETLAGALSASSSTEAELRAPLGLDALVGTFDFDAFTDGSSYDGRSAWITIGVGEGETSGVVAGQVSGSDPCHDGDACTAWAKAVDIATWGTAGGS